MLFIEHAASESHLLQLGSVTAEVELNVAMHECRCVLEEDRVEFRPARPGFLATDIAVIGVERPEPVCEKCINIYQRHPLKLLRSEPSIPRSMVNPSKPRAKAIRTSK